LGAERKSGRRKETGIWERRHRGKFIIFEQFKRRRESRIPQLDSFNKFNVLAIQINAGILDSEGREEKIRKVEGRTLREVTVKIGLERIDT